MTASKTTRKATPMNSVIRQYANRIGSDRTDAAKALRSKIRAARRINEPALLKAWPALKNHEKGNRYPDVPAALAEKLIAGTVIVQARKG